MATVEEIENLEATQARVDASVANAQARHNDFDAITETVELTDERRQELLRVATDENVDYGEYVYDLAHREFDQKVYDVEPFQSVAPEGDAEPMSDEALFDGD